jgi:hypothetical protein
MWIVKNVLRGSIAIEDLRIKIPAKDYFDLDKVGRDRAEASKQLKLALEEGYLQNVKKQDPGANEAVIVKEETRSEIKTRIEELRQVILNAPDKETVLKAIGELRGLLAGNEKEEKTGLKREVLDLRKAILEERQRSQTVLTQFNDFRDTLLKEFKGLLSGLVAAGPRMGGGGEGDGGVGERVRLTEVEVKARLKLLEQREKELQANFESIGKKTEGDAGTQGIADLLTDID